MANIITITEDLAELIRRDGDNGKLDLSDRSMRWTWFDDDADNCGSSLVESIQLDTDCNDCENVLVEFDNRGCESIASLDYEDTLGNNFTQWLYMELF